MADELYGHSVLEGAPCIRSLSITFSSPPTCQTDINALGKVILSLHNLERLILKYHSGQPFRRRRPLSIFQLPSGSTLPPLRVLSFTNLSFDSEEAVRWAQCLQHQDLQSLALDGTTQICELLSCFSGCVSNLKSLAIRVSDGTSPDIIAQIVKSLDGFLRKITELRAFTAYDLSKEVPRPVTLYHGNHLRLLRFRHTRFPFLEMPELQNSECLFSPDELRDLSTDLPLVERLGFELFFKGKMRNSQSLITIRTRKLTQQALRYP